MSFALTALLLAGAAAPEAEVNAAVDAVIAAVNGRDDAGFAAISHPDLAIQILRFTPQGSRFESVSRAAMLKTFADKSIRVDERLTSRTTHITRDFAQVWAPYTLDVNGKRVHCGVDSFALMKIDGRWQLTSLAWTADPDGCPK